MIPPVVSLPQSAVSSALTHNTSLFLCRFEPPTVPATLAIRILAQIRPVAPTSNTPFPRLTPGGLFPLPSLHPSTPLRTCGFARTHMSQYRTGPRPLFGALDDLQPTSLNTEPRVRDP